MTEQKKQDWFGFEEVRPGLYHNKEHNMTLTASEFNGGLAIILGTFMFVAATVGGCTYAAAKGIQKLVKKPALEQKVNPVPAVAVQNIQNAR